MTSLIEKELNAIKEFQSKAPVDVVSAAKAVGLGVWEDPNIGKGISGKIVKDKKYGGESGYAIFVNAFEPKVRKRFTVAHELGHFLFHRNDIGDGLIDDALYRSGLSSTKETEANRFAANLLMPHSLIKRLMSEGVEDLNDLAKKLLVSKHALKIRLNLPV